VVENKYDESKKKLEEVIDEIEGVLGNKDTSYHLFVYLRMASI